MRRLEILCVWWEALSNLLFLFKDLFYDCVYMGISVYRYVHVRSEALDALRTGDTAWDVSSSTWLMVALNT